MGENGGRTTGQLLSHGPCACLAWCLMSLAHIQRAGTAGLAVSDDGDGRCRKILFLQGCSTKGYCTRSNCLLGALGMQSVAESPGLLH